METRISLLENHTISFTSSRGSKGCRCAPLRISLGFTLHQAESHRAVETWPGAGGVLLVDSLGVRRGCGSGQSPQGGSLRHSFQVWAGTLASPLGVSVPHVPRSAFESSDTGCDFPVRSSGALWWIFLAACGLPLDAGGGSCAPVAMSGLLAGVSSLVEVHGLSCPAAGGIILDQGLDPCSLH